MTRDELVGFLDENGWRITRGEAVVTAEGPAGERVLVTAGERDPGVAACYPPGDLVPEKMEYLPAACWATANPPRGAEGEEKAPAGGQARPQTLKPGHHRGLLPLTTLALAVATLISACATGTPHVRVCEGLDAQIAAGRAEALDIIADSGLTLDTDAVQTVPVLVLDDETCSTQSWAYRVEVCWDHRLTEPLLAWEVTHELLHVAAWDEAGPDREHRHPIWAFFVDPPPKSGPSVECRSGS